MHSLVHLTIDAHGGFEAHGADLIQLVSIETGKVFLEATFEVGLPTDSKVSTDTIVQ